MDRVALRAIAGLLLYGDSESPDRVANDLVARADPHMWELLVGTIHSDEELSVRIRCLEVLAKAASSGSEEMAQQILAALRDRDDQAHGPER
jgi:hypothetical protein